MSGAGAHRVMQGVRLAHSVNMSEGTATIAVPDGTNIPNTRCVPVSHLHYMFYRLTEHHGRQMTLRM